MLRRGSSSFGRLFVALMALAGADANAQESKSAPLLKSFVDLAGGEMRYIAAKVPTSPDEFVGALHIPGVQLVVIWARYQQPVLLTDMLGKRNYQGVYTDLNSASYTIAASKVFIEDLREDGLYPKRQDDNTASDMYEAGGRRVSFDGDWKKQKLSEKEYQEMFSGADDRYVRALGLLITELKRGS